jgi:hypothetical protein
MAQGRACHGPSFCKQSSTIDPCYIQGMPRPGESSADPPDDLFVRGAAVVYRLYDIGYAIELARVAELLSSDAPARARAQRIEAQALQIANPPVTVALGEREIVVDSTARNALLVARIFDFGVASLQLEISGSDTMSWSAFVAFARTLQDSWEIDALFAKELDALRTRIAPAIERAGLAPVREEYIVFRISALRTRDGGVAHAHVVLTDERLAPLLLGEPRALAPKALRELLQHRFSYYADDLVVLTWENALVLEPATNDRDVEYILEFANAQLLELRFYDAVLDAELPVMYDRVAHASSCGKGTARSIRASRCGRLKTCGASILASA